MASSQGLVRRQVEGNMTLKERLMEDLKNAMRSHDVPRREVIRMVRAAIKNAEIELQRDVTDEEGQDLISREAKRRREAVALYRQAGRDDLVAEEETQLRILDDYMPRQLTRSEIADVVRRIVADLGASDMRQLGLVMRQAMSELKGEADGGLVNQVARDILSG